jgi:hypothetical protein
MGGLNVGLNVGLLASLLGACSVPTLHAPSAPSPPAQAPAAPAQTAPPAPPSAPAAPAVPGPSPGAASPAQGSTSAGGARPAQPGPGVPAPGTTRPPAAGGAARPAPRPAQRHPVLGPPLASRSWDEFRLQAARRLVAAHPDGSYTGPVPEPLLAIPVLEVELNGDGSVRRVQVLRHPRQARDTTQLAIDAVHRAAPYGDVSRLPRPWKWAEVFLFDDDRRFKPRTLDQ